MANLIFIDNFDSFTYNLVDQFRSLGHQVTIYRNNISLNVIETAINELDNPVVILSPGPGAPSDAGCMPELLQHLKEKRLRAKSTTTNVPVIGICLGHQAIVEAYGGKVAGAGEIVHGKVSMMTHYNHTVYQGLPSPLAVARYHSLVATSVPDTLTITARADGQVMSVVQEEDKVCGYQFHPESIMTTYGAQLLENTIEWALN